MMDEPVVGGVWIDAAGRDYALTVRGRTWRLGGDRPPGRTHVMGIVNVTPDSFSDGGRFFQPDAALAHAEALLREGADIVDVGGESTRPGHEPVPADLEMARVLPVIKALRARTDAPISIDTRRAAVARAAVAAGADLVNDVSGLADPEMAELVASTGVPVVVMHGSRLLPGPDPMERLVAELDALCAQALAHGVRAQQLIVDPGIGFGKDAATNLLILRQLGRLAALGRPVLVGTSRKSFIGAVLGLPVEQRDEATAATLVAAILGGAHIVRVHDVARARQAARIADAILGRVEPAPPRPGAPPPPVTRPSNRCGTMGGEGR